MRQDDRTGREQRLLVEETTTALTVPVNHGLSSHWRPPGDGSHPFYYEYMTPPPEGFLVWMSRTLLWLFKFVFLCCISAVSYGVFYKLMMPNMICSKELHFDYFYEQTSRIKNQMKDHRISLFGKRRDKMMHSEFEEAVLHQVPTLPTATIDLTARHNEWEAHLDEVLPHPKHSRLLKSYQEYYIEMKLFLPETEANKAAGMFGIEMDLWSSDVKVATSRKSYRFPHQTNWIRQLSKFITVGPILIGAMEETRTVTGFVFRRFIESEKHPLQHVIVKLLQPEKSKVEIIGGEVLIGEELSMFQEILRTWFWSCYCIGTTCFAMWYVVIQNALVYYWNKFSIDEPSCELDPNDDLQFNSFDDIDFGAEEEEEFVDAVEDEEEESPAAPSNTGQSFDAEAHPEIRRRGSIVMEEGEDENDWEDLDMPMELSTSSGLCNERPAVVQTASGNATGEANPRRNNARRAVSPRVSFGPGEPHPQPREDAPTATLVFEARRDRAINNPPRQRRELRREMTDEELRDSLFGQVPESTLEHVRERLGSTEQRRGWFIFF